MTVLHSGTTKKYSANWEAAFGKAKRSEGKAVPAAAAKSKPAKKAKPAKKKAQPAASPKLKTTAKASAKKVAKKPSTPTSRAAKARAEAEAWEKALNTPAEVKRARKEQAEAMREAKKPLTKQLADAAKEVVGRVEEAVGMKPAKRKKK